MLEIFKPATSKMKALFLNHYITIFLVFNLTVQTIPNLLNCSTVQTIPNLFNALCYETAAVENVLDVSQPAGDGQATHPLVVGRGHVAAGLHQFGIGILKKVSWLNSCVFQIERRKNTLKLHLSKQI